MGLVTRAEGSAQCRPLWSVTVISSISSWGTLTQAFRYRVQMHWRPPLIGFVWFLGFFGLTAPASGSQDGTHLLASVPNFPTTGSLSLAGVVRGGTLTGVVCEATCLAQTSLPPTALARALGLPAPRRHRDGWQTSGRGWRIEQRASGSAWQVQLTPLGRALSVRERAAFPHQMPSESRPRTQCTVLIDVRGFNSFVRDLSSRVYDDQGNQLWPDPVAQRNLQVGFSVEANDSNLHQYITSEAELSPGQIVTRIKASRLQSPRSTPGSNVLTDVVLGKKDSAQFRAAGSGCRLVYLMQRQ